MTLTQHLLLVRVDISVSTQYFITGVQLPGGRCTNRKIGPTWDNPKLRH